MLKTKKKLLITIALLLTVIMGVSVTAYTLAGAGTGDTETINSEEKKDSSKLSGLVYMTNIDLIIQDSLKEGYCYNIVHMIPASMKKNDKDYSGNSIDQYVSSGNFKNLVIDKNTTGETAMAENRVRVITLPIDSSVVQSTVIADGDDPLIKLPDDYSKSVSSFDSKTYNVASLLSDADLLYIESPSKNSYSDSSAMSDDLFSYIKNTYVGNDHKPLILDDVTGSSDGDVTTDLTYRTAVNEISGRYLYSPVFAWSKQLTVADFLAGNGSSHFFAKTLSKDKATGKILRIRKSSNIKDSIETKTNADGSVDVQATRNSAMDIDWITEKLINADKSQLYYGAIEKYPGYDKWQAKPATSSKTQTEKDAEDDLWNQYYQTEEYYYGGLSKIRDQYDAKENENEFFTNPAYFTVEDVDTDSLTADMLSEDAGYDFVIIEDSAITVKISDQLKNAIVSLANGKQYMIFDADNIDSSSPGSVGTANKYLELYQNLVTTTTNEPLNPSRTLVVKNGFFADNKTGALTDDGAKKIANIINGSNYRGSENNGRNGKKYRVLEIQPCYPIDQKVAKNNGNMAQNNLNYKSGVTGNYYQHPNDILKKAPEETDGKTDYYAFELSKARIAYATGLKYEQIELDQMSTEEFISTKEVVVDSYDLVYIGGDFSALVPYNLENIFSAEPNTGSGYREKMLEATNKVATNFDMYTHTGGMVELKTAHDKTLYGTYYVGGTSDSSVPANIGYGVYQQNGKVVATSTVYNGNDITATKYKELKDYIDAGMPIIFGSDVTQPFEQIYDKSQLEKLANHFIDPTSNMYAILDYAFKKCNPTAYSTVDPSVTNNSVVKSIYWGMDVSRDDAGEINVERVSNDKKQYGTVNEYTRYNNDINNSIVACIDAATLRPTLQIRNAPKDYQMNDVTTHYTSEDNKMTISVSGLSNDQNHTGMKATLYVDKDGNGTFDETEAVMTKDMTSQGDAVDLEYQFEQSDFYGLISWKIVATTEGTGATVAPSDVRTGFAYYKRNDDVEKKEVRTLQIMPCTNAEEGKKSYGYGVTSTLYMCTQCQWANLRRLDYNAYTWKNNLSYSNEATNGDQGSVHLGRHKHKFGIVEYNSNSAPQSDSDKVGEGAEGWATNLASNLYKDYDFSLDILYLDEVNEIAEIVKANKQEVQVKEGEGEEATTVTKVVNTPMLKKDANNGLVLNTNGVTRTDENGNEIQPSAQYENLTWVEYYQALADKYYDLYEQAKEKASKSEAKANMDATLTELKSKVPESGAYLMSGCRAFIKSPDVIQYWIDSESYSYYFEYVSYDYYSQTDYVKNYNEWARLQDKEIEYYNMYKKYACYASTEDSNWFENNYDMVVLGFADSFNNKDLTVTECNQLKSYITDGGTVLLTHDSTTKYADPKEGAFNLTTQLRTTFGLDRYHASIDLEKSSYTDGNGTKQSLKFPFFTFDNSSIDGRAKYYITPFSSKQTDQETTQDRLVWEDEIAHIPGLTRNSNADTGNAALPVALVGITDGVGIFRTSDNGSLSPYKYAKYNWYDAVNTSGIYNNSDNSKLNGTDRAERINKGIVTTYPFNLGETLTISPTHVQSYAADLEDSNMTVWYSLGTTPTEGDNLERSAEYKSSLFAASPKDGMDSYFIYTYHSGKGTVHYCGAGHSIVTGPGKNNNDERMLFMNIAVDSVRRSGSKPKITLYDKTHKKVTEKSSNGLQLDEKGNYVYTLSDASEVPEFDFDVRFSELSELKDVYMFYDFNYDCKEKDIATDKYVADYSNRFKDDKNHVLVHHYTSNIAHEGSLVEKNAASNPNNCSTFNDDDYQSKLTNSNPIITNKTNLLSVKVRNSVPNKKDTLTFLATSTNNTVMRVPEGENKLALNVAKDSTDSSSTTMDYFTPYGNYTYLVLYAVDGKGKTAYVRIKIKLTEHLFDLTYNSTMALPHYCFSYQSNKIDITNKTRFYC